MMQARTNALIARHNMVPGAAYRWDLNDATIVIDGRTFRIVTVGTVIADQFLWSWANDAIPASAKIGIDRIKQFGVENDLPLFVEPSASGGLAQAKECVAIAGRILDAQGVWIVCRIDGDGGSIVFAVFERN